MIMFSRYPPSVFPRGTPPDRGTVSAWNPAVIFFEKELRIVNLDSNFSDRLPFSVTILI
jgi:hypothetical protein